MPDYNLGTASGRIVVDGSGASKGFDVARRSGQAFFDVVKMRVNDVQQLGRRMAVAGGTSVTAFGAMIKTAADFQQQMSGVFAVANATVDQQEALRQKALDLGKATVFSASEAANALEELVKAGVPVEDILNGAADAAVNLAAAGGVSIPEAATIAANAMNQFGLKGKEVTKIADVLAGVANTSASDVTGIGTSLQQTGAVAHLAGLSFHDTAVAIGEMADAGVQGSDAGTSLKQMLINLIPQTQQQYNLMQQLGLITFDLKDANQALAKVGLQPTAKSIADVTDRLAKYVEASGGGTKASFRNYRAVLQLLEATGGMRNQLFKANGDVRSLRGLQDKLSASTRNLTKEQKLNTFSILFGSDSMRAAAIMSNEGAKGYDRFTKAVSKTKAADVARVRLGNLAGATEQFKGSLQTVAITIGTTFLPLITKIVNGATAILNAFISLPHGVQVAVGVFGLLLSSGTLLIGLFLAFLPVIASFIAHILLMRAIGTVTAGFRVFYATLRGGEGVLAATQLGLLKTGTEMRALSLKTLFTGRMMLAFGKAMLFVGKALKFALLNPYVLALVALVAIGILLYKKWKPFRDLVNEIAAALKGYLLAAWAALKRGVEDFLGVLERFGRYLQANLLPVLQEVGRKLVTQLVQAWNQIKAAVQQQLLPAFKQFQAALQGARDSVNKDIVPALQRFWQAAQPVVAAIGRIAEVVGRVLLKALVTAGKFLVTVILPILIKLVGFLLGVGIKAFVQFALGVIQAITGILKILTGFINLIDDIFHGRWGQIWGDVLQIFSGFADTFIGLFRTMFAFPIAIIQEFGSKIAHAFTSMISGLFGGGGGGGGAGPLNFIPKIFQAAFGAVVRIITLEINIIKTVITTALAVISAVWGAVWGTFGPLVKAVLGLILAILNLFWVIVKGLFLVSLFVMLAAVKGVFGLIAKIIGLELKIALAIVRAVWGAIKSVFTTVMGFLSAFIAKQARGWSRILGPPVRAMLRIVQVVFNAVRGVVVRVLGFIAGFIRGQVNAVKGFWSDAWNAMRTLVSNAWGRIKTAVSNGVKSVKEIVSKTKDAILGPIKDLANDMYNAGVELMKQLLAGITSMISSITDKINGIAGKIGGFLPGSPVKTGPLVTWNDGGAGKKLIGLLAKGLSDTAPVDNAIKDMASYINKQALTLSPIVDAQPLSLTSDRGTAVRSAVAATRPGLTKTRQRPNRGGGGQPRSRLIDGRIRIDEESRVWVEGIAEDVVDDNERFDGSRGRQ